MAKRRINPETGQVYELRGNQWVETTKKAKGGQKSAFSELGPFETPARWAFNIADYIAGPSAERREVGIGRGLLDVGEGIAQTGLQAGEAVGLLDPGTARQFTESAQREREFYEQTPAGQSGMGQFGRFVGQTAPFAAIPGGRALTSQVGIGAGVGGAIGGTQFQPENQGLQSRAGQAAIGAGVGGAVPFGMAGAGKGARYLANASRGLYRNPSARAVEKLSEQYNVPVYADDISQSPSMKQFGTMMDVVPGLGTAGARKTQNKAAREAAKRVARQFDPDPNVDVDDAIRAGMRAHRDEMFSEGQRLFRQADEALDPKGNVGLTNMRQTAERIIEENKDKTTARAQASVKAAREYLESGDDVFSGVRGLRSELGDELKTAKRSSETGSAGRASALNRLRQAVDQDLESFAKQADQEAYNAWREANRFWSQEYTPLFKDDKRILKSLADWDESSPYDPEKIFTQFVKNAQTTGRNPSGARKLYQALSEDGRGAVRARIARETLDDSIDPDTGVFSPAKFKQGIKKYEDAIGQFMTPDERQQLQGFAKLMKHTEHSGQYMANPPTGARLLMPMAAMGGTYYLSQAASPMVLGGAAGTAAIIKKLMTTKSGRRLLMASSRRNPGTKGMDEMMRKVSDFASRAGAQAATSGEGGNASDTGDQGRGRQENRTQ